ncbi:MAG: exodeoxyribonuclease V subunit alpha [Deltaproteobacteria bacterium]|jgi:exodeoxyribonuclease V alpha subunit|nr:exodeoxyribonuclease V subunit alpha [Deltaproteobacteria bacterium]MBT4641823.1 exodeoxyribonuclease V subunit alpha [Deltaproteobacteria bacterium]MBT6504564.1 exodeoxyribonuclease V subunit alpha [Deltaproteobacteria bacterium]MBT7151181.1 exodeoxyribonuclease V subunit alpha [Deltaproteobacteria bacterium]MBT7710509.1 exodeoxyribonuclease V subunit alpha [Deltaproteobacteria bacterium]
MELTELRSLFQRSEFSAINRHFAEFMLRLSGSSAPEFFLACGLVSHRAEQGDVCLNLADYAEKAVTKFSVNQAQEVICPPLQSWIEILQKCKTVGKPGERAPLILDTGSTTPRLYLLRYWQYEHRLTDYIGHSVAQAPLNLDRELLSLGLKRLFPGNGKDPDMQAIAARAALEKKFCVITGGPGTGKTSTVLKIIILLLEQPGELPLKLALVAPTGKAANRLKESIQSSLTQVDQQILSTEKVLSEIPTETSTIHRLLGSIRNSPRFKFNKHNPLPHDCIIVDEVSMVDLALMSKLVEALNPTCRLILLGDKNQLSSVESGSVLGDICFEPELSGNTESTPLTSTTVNLVKSYRFDENSGIGRLSALINDGQANKSLELLIQSPSADLSWKQIPPPGESKQFLMETILPHYRSYFDTKSAVKAFRKVSQFGVLCALRSGLYGAIAINRQIEDILTEAKLIPPETTWYSGRPVMITRNDYNLQLFNGDIGIILPDREDDDRLKVFFDLGEKGYRKIVPVRLPEHESAYAMTIHKSQGSEFDRVLILLSDQDALVLSRELIYTGISRAREAVEIWGDEKVFLKAICRRTERSSGLKEALSELTFF